MSKRSWTGRNAAGIAAENPIGLALAGLAVGFLAGSLIPISPLERRRLGPITDSAIDQAQAAAIDLAQAGKAVVSETAHDAAQTAFASAQRHGHDVVEALKARADAG